MARARGSNEIITGHQDPGIAIGRLVEDEVRVLAAVVLVALFREQSLAEAGALDGFEVLLRNDHVGVDIDDLQRRRDAFQRGELVHGSIFMARSMLRSDGCRTALQLASLEASELQEASKLQLTEAFNPIEAANPRTNPRANPSVNPDRVAERLFRAGLDLLHVGIGQAEMVANFVDQDVADDLAQGFVVLGPIIQDRSPVEPDHVR